MSGGGNFGYLPAMSKVNTIKNTNSMKPGGGRFKRLATSIKHTNRFTQMFGPGSKPKSKTR